jgi:hypothetical protein
MCLSCSPRVFPGQVDVYAGGHDLIGRVHRDDLVQKDDHIADQNVLIEKY